MACEDVSEREKPLCWGWDKELFMKKEKQPSTLVTEVDEAVTDKGVWFSLRVICILNFIILEVSKGARGCACHTLFLLKTTPSRVRARWKNCPPCCFRYPELCAGDLLAYLRDLVKLQGVLWLQ